MTDSNRFSSLAIFKRDADCYDVTNKGARVAALRSEFTEDPAGARTAIPGTWRIRWEHRDAKGDFIIPYEPLAKLRFNSAIEAFAFYVSQVLA